MQFAQEASNCEAEEAEEHEYSFRKFREVCVNEFDPLSQTRETTDRESARDIRISSSRLICAFINPP